MEFHAIVGNPPYNKSDGGGTGDSSAPIYHYFVKAAKKVKPKYISFIIPSRWMKGGKGLDSFRSDMMEDRRLRFLYDYYNSKECFPSVALDSGVCYFLWDRDYNGLITNIYKTPQGEEIKSERLLKTEFSNTIIRDVRRLSIIKKISEHNIKRFSSIVSARKPYKIATDLFNHSERYSNLSLRYKSEKGFLKIYGVFGNKGGAKRTIGYINKDKFLEHCVVKKEERVQMQQKINNYKLFISYAYSTNSTVFPEVIVGKPGEICTETFLEVGTFLTEEECSNCLKYMKGSFFRALLFFNRIQKNSSQKTFDLIPLEKFTSDSDIDWTISLNEVDKQLFEKYKLTKEEREYIDKVIKPMKGD